MQINRISLVPFKDIKPSETFEIPYHVDYKGSVLFKLLSADGDKYNAVDLKTGSQVKIQEHIQVRLLNCHVEEYT